jgi:cell division transport system permease protein
MARNVKNAEPTTSNRLGPWVGHHVKSFLLSLDKIGSAPATTLMTVAVIAITLSLPTGFYLFLKNINHLAADFRSSTQISLYLDLSLSTKEAEAVLKQIRATDNVKNSQLINKDEALNQFRESSGFGNSIDTLAANPLPHTIILEPNEDSEPFEVKNLLNQLQLLPEVELAKLDTEWLERLFAIIDIAKRTVIIITLLFSCAVLLVIGNTIRLDIQNRYQEIVVTKLIGATDAFIRRPFLYGGVWYGLLGGIMCWLIVELGYLAISGPLGRLNLTYQVAFEVSTFSIPDFIILVTSSTLLGLAGSWVAVARHLNQIEPT